LVIGCLPNMLLLFARITGHIKEALEFSFINLIVQLFCLYGMWRVEINKRREIELEISKSVDKSEQS